MTSRKLLLVSLALIFAGTVAPVMAQDAGAPDQQQAPGGPGQRVMRGGRGNGSPPLMGKIAALKTNSLELTRPDGTTVTVTLTGKTEFRKDRQPATVADFKVGDMVFVRGEQNADKTVTAIVVSARGANGPGDGGQGQLGELGKDYVVGEIRSVDAPTLTVLRPDNVTQTIELNEDSSLHRGRESITMADIQPGDHVIARGAMLNSVFVPKNVMILSAEQWQRMQEMGARRRNGGEGAPANGRPDAPTPQPPNLNQPQ